MKAPTCRYNHWFSSRSTGGLATARIVFYIYALRIRQCEESTGFTAEACPVGGARTLLGHRWF